MLRSIVERLLAREGGLNENPDDRGGVTNWGITKPFLADLRGHAVSDDDIRNLSKDEARQAYIQWATLLRFDVLCDAAVLEVDYKFLDCAFDWMVNAGGVSGIRLIQAILGVPIDGVIGPDTLGAFSRKAGHLPVNVLVKSRIRTRINQCLRDRSQMGFLVGWVERDMSFL